MSLSLSLFPLILMSLSLSHQGRVAIGDNNRDHFRLKSRLQYKHEWILTWSNEQSDWARLWMERVSKVSKAERSAAERMIVVRGASALEKVLGPRPCQIHHFMVVSPLTNRHRFVSYEITSRAIWQQQQQRVRQSSQATKHFMLFMMPWSTIQKCQKILGWIFFFTFSLI